jgi:hypothetical protein
VSGGGGEASHKAEERRCETRLAVMNSLQTGRGGGEVSGVIMNTRSPLCMMTITFELAATRYIVRSSKGR